MCRKWLVAGKVQGVFFRASTARVARSLSLGGHAINLPDGRVEVVACGTADALDRLRAYLEEGPPVARVDGITDASHACVDGDFRTG